MDLVLAFLYKEDSEKRNEEKEDKSLGCKHGLLERTYFHTSGSYDTTAAEREWIVHTSDT